MERVHQDWILPPGVPMPDRRPLVVVVADRGAGKTTLLRRWEHEIRQRDPSPTIWLDVANAGGDSGALLRRLRALEIEPRPLVVLVDDVDRLNDREVWALLIALIDRCRHQFVLAARTVSELPLHRWRASGSLVEVGNADLRLGIEAIQRLAAERELVLEAGVLGRIHELTEGWAEGVVTLLDRLAADRSRDASDVVESAAVECAVDLATWIEGEIDPTDFGFLIRTSILARFDRELGSVVAQAVAGEAEATVDDLGGLIRRTPFTEPVDRAASQIRVHRLARLGLWHRLQQQESAGDLSARHLAAARRLADTGRYREAIEHGLAAGRAEWAADVLARMWQWDSSEVSDEDIERVTAAAAADYVPHLVTRALGRLRARDYPLARDLLGRLTRMNWSGPLPHGLPDLGSALSELSANLPEMTSEHMSRYLDDEGLVPTHPAGPGELVTSYTAAHYCYWLGRLDEAKRRAGSILVGHRSIGRAGLADQVVTVLACDLMAMVHHDRGETEEATRCLNQATELLAEYGIDELDTISYQAYSVHELAHAVTGSDPVDERLTRLERLYATAWASEVQVHAALEIVRLLDQLLRFDEAAGALADLETYLDGRHTPPVPLHTTRLAQLKGALSPDLSLSAPAMHITTGERVVLYRLADRSLSQDDVADQLGLSINTVKSHLRSIYQKLGVGGRKEAVAEASERGMLATVEPWISPG